MVRMGMADKYRIDFFPAQIEPSKGNLCPFTAVEQEQVSLTAQQDGGKMSVRKGHHAAATENKGFKIHGMEVYRNRSSLTMEHLLIQ